MEWIESEGLKYRIELVHISEIKPGDLIIREWDGAICEVGKNHIKYGGFMGTSIFGDSYHSGYKKVRKVILFNPLKDK